MEEKNIIADAGMELTDDELDGVAGGGRMPLMPPMRYQGTCPKCQSTVEFKNYDQGAIYCPKCQAVFSGGADKIQAEIQGKLLCKRYG